MTTDPDVLKAVCALAGADSDVTVEELAILTRLAKRAGLGKPFDALVGQARSDGAFRAKQLDVIAADPDGTINALIKLAQEDGSFDKGHLVMLLWRVAAKLDMNADHFDDLLAESKTAAP